MDTLYIAIGSAITGAILGGLIVTIQARLAAIERELAERRELPKRHTYATTAGLEDLTAVLLDIKLRRAAENTRRQAEDIRLDQALDIARLVRQGPKEYPIDRPAGPRPDNF